MAAPAEWQLAATCGLRVAAVGRSYTASAWSVAREPCSSVGGALAPTAEQRAAATCGRPVGAKAPPSTTG